MRVSAGLAGCAPSVNEQRDCMVLLHAEFSEQGFLSWPRELFQGLRCRPV
jgi:hypothetical protein